MISALGTAVAAILVVGLVLVLPGRLVLGRLLGRVPALEAAGLALVVGWMAVAGVSHALNIIPLEVLPFIHIPSWIPVVAAVLIVGVWGRRGVGAAALPCSAADRREARILGVATAAVAVLYLLQYDRDLFAFTCTHRAVSIATRVDVGALWGLVDAPRVLLFDGENDTHGVVAILAVLPSMLGFFGVRLGYAVLHAGLASAAWILVRRAGFGPAVAAVVFAVLALHPTMLGTPVDDVNHVALLASMAVWATLLSARAEARLTRDAAFVLGLLTALAVGAWHPFLVSLPALALLLGPRRIPLLRAAAMGLLSGVMPFVLRHTVALGGPFVFESFAENAATAHALAGAEFAWSGLLNWPFAPEVVRTPGNPLPVALLLPAWLLATSGAVLAAIASVGLVALLRERRPLGLAAILWLVPGLLLLAPQENWFEIEKLQIATVWLAPVALALAAGLASLASPRWLAAIVVVTVLLVLGGRQLAEVDVPVDPRLQGRWPHLRAEDPGDVQRLRDRLTRGDLVPRFDVLGPDPRDVGDRFAVLFEELAAPRFRARPTSPREQGLRLAIPRVWQLFLQPQDVEASESTPAAATSAVSVDLSTLPSTGPLVSASSMPRGGEVAPQSVALPWTIMRVTAFQQLGAPGDVHLIVSGPAPDMLQALETDFPELTDVALPPVQAPPVRPVRWEVVGDRVVIALPDGARLRITEIVSIEPSRIRRWMLDPHVQPDADGRLPLRGPGFARHN